MAKILVCERYKNLRTLYACELQAEGYEIVLAADVNETFQKLESADVALVVMDDSIHVRDRGHKLAAALRRRNGPPVIWNTAGGLLFEDGPSVPGDAWLVKSSDLGELKKKIGEMLSRSRKGIEVEACV